MLRASRAARLAAVSRLVPLSAARVPVMARALGWSRDGEGAKAGAGAADGGKGASDGESGEPAGGSGREGGEAGDGGNAVMRAGVGDNAPRPGHVLAIPVRRPCLPWFLTQVYTDDVHMVEALTSVERNRSSGNGFVGLFMPRVDDSMPPREDVSAVPRPLSELHTMGSLASIQTVQPTPDGGVIAWFLAHRRIRALEEVAPGPPPLAHVQHLDPDRTKLGSDMVKALSNEVVATIRSVVRINPMFKDQMQYITQRVEVHDAFRLADFAAAITSADAADIQRVLEAEDIEERLHLALQLMLREEELSKLQAKIASSVDERMKESQRKYFLNEQLKSIKKELGLEKDDKDALIQKFLNRIEGMELPASAREVLDEEMDKLRVLERNSSEFNVTRNYLDWLTSLPWGVYSDDAFDLGRAREILDEDHYGMDDVKERILEFIAVGKLLGSVQGKIICLVGPPGVGKTSIGQSVARALGRKFYRFSVGGLSDVAEIKGHRRTYVGAMPGKLIQCLKATKVSNPVVLIDEVDKMGTAGFRGDPASALLEMLDPNQNAEFMDHYLDTPVDASKVLFLCTANVMDTIPGPLRDRMEVIDLSGYDADEKLQIAHRYLEPKARKETGLEQGARGIPESLGLDDSAVRALIRWYCRESGVRNLEKHIQKIYRKAALRLVQAKEAVLAEAGGDDAEAGAAAAAGEDEDDAEAGRDDDTAPAAPAGGLPPVPEVDSRDWAITEDSLADYVGKPVFTTDRLYDAPPPGVVMGLAYTALGGAALYIETSSPDLPYRQELRYDADDRAGAADADGAHRASTEPAGARGEDGADEDGTAGPAKARRGGTAAPLQLTGQMGNVMQESVRIAQTFARLRLHEMDPGNGFLDRATIHVHVPEGAVPKDGPSAGVTMVTALLSIALDRPVRPDVAMTGEITLTGKVLAVGGIREKLMAARRAGITCVIVPKGCEKDVDELPEHAKAGLDIRFASEYRDVFEVAFAPQDAPAAE